MTMRALIIIGAGRSGTNILRDTLTRIPGYATWDCDEINLIWRHGNISMPHDMFGAREARPEVRRYMQNAFASFQRKSGATTVVEKTCANSLRVPFIDAIFPEARYLYIVRDGRDVALSAAQRWTASVEARYLLKKLRHVPITDVPHYGFRFLANRLHQRRSVEKRQKAWGPVFPGMAEMVKSKPLLDVCAAQWAACIEASDAALAGMSQNKKLKVTYEELVSDAAGTMQAICEWLGPGVPGQLPSAALNAIHQGSLNGWKRKLQQFSPEALSTMSAALKSHGYEATT